MFAPTGLRSCVSAMWAPIGFLSASNKWVKANAHLYLRTYVRTYVDGCIIELQHLSVRMLQTRLPAYKVYVFTYAACVCSIRTCVPALGIFSSQIMCLLHLRKLGGYVRRYVPTYVPKYVFVDFDCMRTLHCQDRGVSVPRGCPG